MESFADRVPTTQRRIIKSRQTHITSVLKEISTEEHACGAPKIVPMRGVRGVEGVEITCRCGETIVIHFELDNVDTSHGS
jgi:hypothetical protein